jgi:hypothetical protein
MEHLWIVFLTQICAFVLCAFVARSIDDSLQHNYLLRIIFCDFASMRETFTTKIYFPAETRFANKRYAPSTPAGN